MYIYYSKNRTGNNYSLFVYPCGFEESNNEGIYPLITAPLQTGTLKI